MKVKLELDQKDNNQLLTYAEAHQAAMVGNANFATPSPAAAVFDPILTAYGDQLADIAAKKAELGSLVAGLPALRDALEEQLTLRGSYVQTTAAGDPAKIVSASMEVQAAATPTTSLPQPQNLVASIGDDEGEIDLACNAIKRAKSYVWECREHVDGQVPGPWTACKISSASKTTAEGLVSGRKYAFRVRALGPNDVESPWSDEAVSMAA